MHPVGPISHLPELLYLRLVKLPTQHRMAIMTNNQIKKQWKTTTFKQKAEILKPAFRFSNNSARTDTYFK